MKWVQTKKVLDRDGVEQGNERKRLFKEYKTRKELNEDLKDKEKFVVWATYPGMYNDKEITSIGELGRRAQRKFEVFCGGFLFYHDFEFKKYHLGEGFTVEGGIPKMKKWPDKEFEHKIYIKWARTDDTKDMDDDDDELDTESYTQSDPNKGKKNKVIIYITPTPEVYNVNPPKPPPPPPPESND